MVSEQEAVMDYAPTLISPPMLPCRAHGGGEERNDVSPVLTSAGADANARLIAAVSDLLAALQEIAWKCADACPGDCIEDAYWHLQEIARAAIAKAKATGAAP
jgi:hypothetical protein